MGEELGIDYYDGALGLVGKPLELSPWLAVYAQAAEFLATRTGPIADIGCGTGRLARLLWLRGERDYWGLDFSPARVAEARQYVPGLTFDIGDVYDQQVRRRLGGFSRFVALELLEHIHDDVGLLKAAPSGALVVFSVPTYDSQAHVRHFASPHEAAKRYDDLLEVNPDHAAVIPLASRPDKKIFVMAGERR